MYCLPDLTGKHNVILEIPDLLIKNTPHTDGFSPTVEMYIVPIYLWQSLNMIIMLCNHRQL